MAFDGRSPKLRAIQDIFVAGKPGYTNFEHVKIIFSKQNLAEWKIEPQFMNQ